MNNFNIDIHCHSSMRPFMGNPLLKDHKIMGDFDFIIESKILDDLKLLLEAFSHIKLHTQSNIDNLYRGQVRVAFVSISPMEKGFCVINQLDKPKGFKAQLLKSKKNDKTVSEKIINALTGFYTKDIDWVKYKINDYFSEYFLEEFNFLTSFDNQVRNVDGGSYTIKIPKNYDELKTNLNNDTIMNLVITVEGAHSLGPVPSLTDLINNQSLKHNKSSEKDEDLCNTFIQNIASLKQKEFPILFISLNHHFWNGLGGHARSITKLIESVISQDEGLNGPLNENGKTVIRELLGTHNGRRILIDIKHMSPKCRQDFYALLDGEFKTKNIPIIASHTGIVSKWNTLQEMVGIVDDNELTNKRNFLHEQTINLCAEDIQRIHNSKGIIGIQLDEKRIMGHSTLKKLKLRNGNNKIIYCEIIWANIFQIVRNINKKTAWDIIAIGSDYDGMINHLDTYPTEADFKNLKNHLRFYLSNTQGINTKGFNLTEFTKAELDRLCFGYSIDEILDKICSQNAMDFLLKNY